MYSWVGYVFRAITNDDIHVYISVDRYTGKATLENTCAHIHDVYVICNMCVCIQCPA